MEKRGVVLDEDALVKSAALGLRCPACGIRVQESWCPACGTKPWEKREEQKDDKGSEEGS